MEEVALRGLACQRHLELVQGDITRLVPADQLLHLAAESQDYDLTTLPPNDPILAGGAQAVLRSDMQAVFFAEGGTHSRQRQRFACAHEFAHLWLHPQTTNPPLMAEESPALYLEGLAEPTVVTAQLYSPQERREREANLFAAEFLLPAPILRRLFLDQNRRADWICEKSGLSETLVLAQLAKALLLDEPTPPPSPTTHQTIHLDPSQRAAVEIEEGPVLLDAGPGTGKTRTLIARIVHLLQNKGVTPDQILALTFSNKAAEEMRTRLREVVGERANLVWIGTFHSFALEMLNREGGAIGLPNRIVVLETADAVALLEERYDLLNLKEFEYLHHPSLPFTDILDCISHAKDELLTPEDYYLAAKNQREAAQTDEEIREAQKALEAARVYQVYQEAMAQTQQMDFGDLLMQSVLMLQTNTEVRNRIQSQYRHVLADEYQDVNRACARLLQMIVGDGKGFWAVGDLRQAIYQFRGASPANILRFDQEFQGGRRMALEYNYRSNPDLVALFNAVVPELFQAASSNGYTTWIPTREAIAVPPLTIAEAETPQMQAEILATQILGFKELGYDYNDQAILVTTNRQAGELAIELERRQIPASVNTSVLACQEVKELLAVLAVSDGYSAAAFLRVAQLPIYGLSLSDVEAVVAEMRDTKMNVWDALASVREKGLLSEEGNLGGLRLVNQIRASAFRGEAWHCISRYLFQTSDYLLPILRENSPGTARKRRSIYALLTLLQRIGTKLNDDEKSFPRSSTLKRLRKGLEVGQLSTLRVGSDGATNGVRVMTVHQSKGLEFPIVYLPNLIKGAFPPRKMGRMAKPPANLLEETEDPESAWACLFFVALTRARDRLVLLRTKTTKQQKAVEPSIFWTQVEPILHRYGATFAPPIEPQIAEPVEIEDALPSPPNTKPTEVTDSQIRSYLDCPRRYYYTHILRLPDREEIRPYPLWIGRIHETIDWLNVQAEAGKEIGEESLEELWEHRYPSGHERKEGKVHQVVGNRALQMLKTIKSSVPSPQSLVESTELVATLPNGSVKVRPDRAEWTSEHTLRLTRSLNRSLKPEDKNDERLALLRMAGKQTFPEKEVEIALFSATDGELKIVEESKRYEPKRIAKFEVALEGIHRGSYPPRPSEISCPACPFLFLCPAGETSETE